MWTIDLLADFECVDWWYDVGTLYLWLFLNNCRNVKGTRLLWNSIIKNSSTCSIRSSLLFSYLDRSGKTTCYQSRDYYCSRGCDHMLSIAWLLLLEGVWLQVINRVTATAREGVATCYQSHDCYCSRGGCDRGFIISLFFLFSCVSINICLIKHLTKR